MILSELGNVYRYRELIGQLTLRNMKAGRKQSMLGLSWIVLQPLAQTAIFTVVFSWFLGHKPSGHPYPLFLFSGIVTWGFLANSLTVASTSVLNNANLIAKTWFPREVLVYAAGLSNVVNLLVNGLVLAIMMGVYSALGESITLSSHLFWVLPAVAVTGMLALGIGMITATMTVLWRDVSYVVPLVLQVWFFATPIVYPLELVSERLPGWAHNLYLLNPMVGVVSCVRGVLLEGRPPDVGLLCVGGVVSLVLFLGGFWFFKRCEGHFADLI